MTDTKPKPGQKIFAFFDFDGTITGSDSFLDFLLFSVGIGRLFTSFWFLIPVLAGLSLKIISSHTAKEKVISFFFKGMTEKMLLKKGMEYSSTRLDRIVKKDAVKRIAWHKSEGHDVVVISASFDFWLTPWCEKQGISLISSSLEISDGRVSGRISGKNCRGAEKARRIREQFDIENAYVYAYGDSKGDTEMLALADEPYLRFFKK